jgi:hypothetical protein
VSHGGYLKGGHWGGWEQGQIMMGFIGGTWHCVWKHIEGFCGP